MRNAAAQGGTEFGQDGREVLVSIALVQEHRLRGCHGDLELRDEGLALRCSR